MEVGGASASRRRVSGLPLGSADCGHPELNEASDNIPRESLKRLSTLALVCACLQITSLALAQTLPIPSSGNYVVQTGDTLESIAQKFLGASGRWRELLTANPDIANPHFITPGSRIRIVPGQSVAAVSHGGLMYVTRRTLGGIDQPIREPHPERHW